MSEIDKTYIESRVNDWVKRVEDLYSVVKAALANSEGIECKSAKYTTMHEELMQNFGVLPKKVPILDLYKDKTLIASFKPVGLWVIGANGRIDILTKSGAFILVDVAEKGNKSEWKVFAPDNRKNGMIFNSELIDKLVREQ
ncbi:MAG: hypothetical protein GY795_22410 [Desulfobacterales bacterium]|nr:hypothetical protein [Desulfobacterales bacterium]